MHEVYLPKLGITMEEGSVFKWMKLEGEAIKAGDLLMEIETDKVTMNVEAEVSGFLRKIIVPEGQKVPVGTVIALIGEYDEPLPVSYSGTESTGETTGETTRPGEMSGQSKPMVDSPKVTPVARRMLEEHGLDVNKIKGTGAARRIVREDVRRALALRSENLHFQPPSRQIVGQAPKSPVSLASPMARRLATEKGLNLNTIPGTGPEGAVTLRDVQRAAAELAEDASIQVKADERTAGMWRVMAERMTHSFQTIPHFYLLREVDASALVDLRGRMSSIMKRDAGVPLTYSDLLVKMVAVTLRHHPSMNATWAEGSVQFNETINIGLATAVDEGLLVPVILRADQLSLREIAVCRHELTERARANKLHLKDLEGGTFTISNLGMYGVDAFNAIITSPQAGVLAVGRIADRVAAHDKQPIVRPTVFLSLACDHRVVDGARAAQFLDDLARFVEEPFRLLI